MLGAVLNSGQHLTFVAMMNRVLVLDSITYELCDLGRVHIVEESPVVPLINL